MVQAGTQSHRPLPLALPQPGTTDALSLPSRSRVAHPQRIVQAGAQSYWPLPQPGTTPLPPSRPHTQARVPSLLATGPRAPALLAPGLRARREHVARMARPPCTCPLGCLGFANLVLPIWRAQLQPPTSGKASPMVGQASHPWTPFQEVPDSIRPLVNSTCPAPLAWFRRFPDSIPPLINSTCLAPLVALLVLALLVLALLVLALLVLALLVLALLVLALSRSLAL